MHFLRQYCNGEIGFVDDAVRAVCKSKYSFRPRIVPIELCWRAPTMEMQLSIISLSREEILFSRSEAISRCALIVREFLAIQNLNRLNIS